MLDKKGFRLNVGIVLINKAGKLFWGKRIKNNNAWQFPQGGVQDYETLEETMYRELAEEVGLMKTDVEIISITKRWLYYRLPAHLRRKFQKPICIGQKQKWFLLRIISPDNKICLNLSKQPEFSDWRWVDYSQPLNQVIYFKKNIYRKVLAEFKPLIKEK